MSLFGQQSGSSQVILVCLKTTPQQFCINNQSMFELFTAYGSIKKLLIFERGLKLTKIFVEYTKLEEAQSAQKYLNNTKIVDNIHCNIYFSHLKQLNLQKVPRTKGVDFTDVPYDYSYSYAFQQFDEESSLEDETNDAHKSDEKQQEIQAKLDQIDNEIFQKVEENYQNAITKLNSRVLKVWNLAMQFTTQQLFNLLCLFGHITFVGRIAEVYFVGVDGENSLNLIENFMNVGVVQAVPTLTERYQPPSKWVHKRATQISITLRLQAVSQSSIQIILKGMNVQLRLLQDCMEVEFQDLSHALLGCALLNNFEEQGVRAIVSFL